MTVELFDTHCHLTLGELGKQPDHYWERARSAGVGRAVVIGITAESSREVVDWVTPREGLYAAIGLHPNHTAQARDEDFELIVELAAAESVVAIGESGLDTYWDDAPLAVQKRWLGRHCELALELDVPLVLHIRDAYPEAARELRPFERRGLRGIIHCFAGEAEEVDPFVDWGWPISFSGILTYDKARNVRGAAERTPLGQCLVETDAPYLTPLAMRGRKNEPAFVVHTARKLAEVKGVTFDEIAEVTTRNANAAFGLDAL